MVAAGARLVLDLADGQPGDLVAPAAVVVLALVAAAAHLLSGAGRRPPRPIAFARSFALVNPAFAMG